MDENNTTPETVVATDTPAEETVVAPTVEDTTTEDVVETDEDAVHAAEVEQNKAANGLA